MKIVTLIEITACRADLCHEHGLSLYIETGDKKILFDAGQSDGFAANAEAMGIDLSQVDFAVLSHGHYDHGGGLKRFLELNSTAPIYISPNAFRPHYNASRKYIGLDLELKESGRLSYVEEDLEIAEGIRLCRCKDALSPYKADSYGLSVLENGAYQPDDFHHEQYLLIQEAGKTTCISGCSHRGILNIVHWFRPDVLVGGFHFMKLETCSEGRRALEDAAEKLMGYPTVYYTGHCTGQTQFDFLKTIMGDRLNALSTGAVIGW